MEKLESGLGLLFRRRAFPERIAEFWGWDRELALPIGTEFDVIGVAMLYKEQVLYITDGSWMLAAVQFRHGEFNGRIGGIVVIENVRYQGIDGNAGMAHFVAGSGSVVVRLPSGRAGYAEMAKMREIVGMEAIGRRVEDLVAGKQIKFVAGDRFRRNCRVVGGGITASICDFESVDMFWNVEQTSVMVFGAIFADNYWKRKFVEGREEFDRGLNLVLRVTDGVGARIVIIPQFAVNTFFRVLGEAIGERESAILENFFQRFFDGEGGRLQREREQMKNAFMLDVSNTEMMLRAALFYCELVYDEEETIDSMRQKKADLVFPFLEREWIEFVEVLRRVLCGIDLRFELCESENMDNEILSVVANVAPVDTKAEVRSLMGLFGNT
jgi:hypothetical protein